MTPAGRRPSFVALLALLLLPAASAAQSVTSRPPAERRIDFEVRDVSRSAALELLASRGVDLIWSRAVDAGTVSCSLRDADVDRILGCILDGTRLEHRRLESGTWIVAPPGVGNRPGLLSGLVVDAGTGRPVPFAEIVLGSGTRTSANASGHFLLAGVLPGRIEVVGSRIGYEPTATVVRVAPGENSRTTVRLIPSAVQLSPVVVRGLDAPTRGANGDATRVALDGGREIGTVTSGIGGAASSATGVRTAPFAGDLLVQGSESGQNPVLLDGFPIFEPVSLGRARGAFSPLAVEEIRVRKAGFPASGGSYIAGALELDQGHGSGGTDEAVTATVDPYAVNMRLDLPFGGGPGPASGRAGGIMVAGRIGLWDLYREPSLDRTLEGWSAVDPILTRQALGDGKYFTDGLVFDRRGNASSLGFSDLHTAVRLPVGDFSRIEASFYRGHNRVDSELFATGTRPSDLRIQQLLLTRDDYEWENLGGQLSLHGLVGERAAMRLRARASLHSLDHRYDYAEGSDIEYPEGEPEPVLAILERELRDRLDQTTPATDANRIAEYAVEGRVDWAATASHRLLAGAEVVRVESNVFISDPNILPLVSRLRHWRLSAFVEDRWTPVRGLEVTPGLRVTRISGRSESWLEPRLAAEASGSELGGWRIRAAGGLYRQYVNRFEFSTLGPSALVPQISFWLPTDATVSPPSARHLSLELAAAPVAGWELHTEVWYKTLDRLLDLDYATFVAEGPSELLEEVTQDVFVAEADGRAWGVGVRASHRIPGGTVRLGYERSASERTFPGRFGDAAQPIPSNLPHLLFAGLDGGLARGFGWRVEARAAWGRTWALRRAYYDYLTLQAQDLGPEIGVPAADRLPARIDLDAGIRWSGRVADAAVEAQLLVENVLDRDNVLDRSLRRDADAGEGVWSTIDRLLPGITPVLTIRIRPF